MGDSHNDFLFVNEALGFSADFSNLQLVESRYRWPAGAGRYEQLLQEADSKIDWRYRIARWMLRVADDFMLKRDTALIALNYFDRMMMSQRRLQRDQFQVAAIACLFIASKLFQKKHLKVSALILYTKNAFQREDILAMEQELLRTHASFFYPITSSTFVSILLNGLKSESPATIKNVIESCQFMIELAACDFFFVAQRASTIAVAAIVVTLEINTKVTPEAVTLCLSNIKAMIDYTIDADAQECINKLRSVHKHNDQRIKDMEEKSTDEEVAKYASGKAADPDASRVATPSPTDPCQRISDTASPPIIANEEYSSGSRKRQRRTSPPSTEIKII